MVLEELGGPSYNICLSVRSSSLIYFKSAAVNESSQNGLVLLTHLVTLTIVLASEHACLILRPVSASEHTFALVRTLAVRLHCSIATAVCFKSKVLGPTLWSGLIHLGDRWNSSGQDLKSLPASGDENPGLLTLELTLFLVIPLASFLFSLSSSPILWFHCF